MSAVWHIVVITENDSKVFQSDSTLHVQAGVFRTLST